MVQKIKDLQLPLAIALGVVFFRFFALLNVLIPSLIFVMLYITLCGIRISKLRFTLLHLWILLFQVSSSLGLYLIINSINPIVAQGTLAILLAPTAISAPVVASMLGAKLSTMVTSTLLSNLMVVVVSPFYFAIAGIQPNQSFFELSFMVLAKVAPLIVTPLLLAVLTQKYFPKISNSIAKGKNIPFYIWSFSLVIVIASTVKYILKMDRSNSGLVVAMFCISALICALQFWFGRSVGRKHGDIVAGGQSVGQKNTVLAIWMSQTFLNPLSSVIPASYVLYQNLFNSYQLWQKRRLDKS